MAMPSPILMSQSQVENKLIPGYFCVCIYYLYLFDCTKNTIVPFNIKEIYGIKYIHYFKLLFAINVEYLEYREICECLINTY